MSRTITLFEFDEVSAGDRLSAGEFRELKNLIVPDPEAKEIAELGPISDAAVCLSLGTRNGKEVIKVKNYVGTISLPCGTAVEILPKIAAEETAAQARLIVTKMLVACGVLPYKAFESARLSAEKLDIYEIYIRAFLDEVSLLYKKGLKAGYVYRESNENFLKGKLKFAEHVKRNFAHGEKFYVGHNEFDFNRPENRLIKSTLVRLVRLSKDSGNRRDLRILSSAFGEVEASVNIEADISKCESGRAVADYKNVLPLCKLFLKGKSFTSFGGKNEATALLFPMDRLFESFVAARMRLETDGWEFSAQARGKFLFEDRKFPLRPDIVLSREGERIIVDTKWKKLADDPRQNYGISQADMYQMYAYHTRFDNVKRVILIYPYAGKDLFVPDYVTRAGDKRVTISVRLFDIEKYLRCGKFFECVYPRDDFGL